jgi:hypothetical protein
MYFSAGHDNRMHITAEICGQSVNFYNLQETEFPKYHVIRKF